MHCITCSDEAIRGRVVQLTPAGMAIVEFDGRDCASARENAKESTQQEISLELVEAAPGDIVLVHASVAIARLGSSKEVRGGNYK